MSEGRHHVYHILDGDDLVYVGRSIDEKARLRAMQKKTENQHLRVIVVMRTDDFNLAAMTERAMIRVLRPALNKYVVSSRGMLGKSVSAETREKLRRLKSGLKHTKEAIERMKTAKIGYIPDEANLRKMIQGNIGRIPTKEHRAKISASLMGHPPARLGHKTSAETKEKIRVAIINHWATKRRQHDPN